MKRVLKTIVACVMMTVMAVMAPLTDLAPTDTTGTEQTAGAPKAKAATTARAATGNNLYISEVRLGQGLATDDEKENGSNCEKASRDLINEGFTILTDESGKYADLNEKAGDDDEGRNGMETDIVVYLGYKTTTDPAEAITDLAVMNMDGGYSLQRYDEMLRQNMESRIKPFMNQFLKIVKEYRENLQAPEDSVNYIRANCMREMMNKIKDDDRDGAPIGDLLVNETIFEMSNAEYYALSESERKEHADIVTYFQQGNDALLYCLTNALAKSADVSEESWINRMLDVNYKQLEYEVIVENPKLTTKTEISNKLDKIYEDKAKAVLKHWDEVSQTLNSVDEAAEKVDNFDEEEALEEAQDEIGDTDPEELTEEQAEDVIDQANECLEAADANATLTVSEFLEGIDYEFNVGNQSGSTLLDFFRLNANAFAGTNIRQLYPLVSVLSEGQIAGLDYLSIRDLIAVGMDDRDGYRNADIDQLEEISLYQGVNREIYEQGGVALTNDAMRRNAVRDDNDAQDPSVSSFTAMWIGIGVGIMAGVFLGISFITWLFGGGAHFAKIMAIGGGILAAVAVAAGLVAVILYFIFAVDEHDIEFDKSIPKYMVDEVDITEKNAKGKTVMIKNQTAYYRATTCNRKVDSDAKKKSEQEKTLEKLGNHGDLNGDVGKQWLALYYVKYENGYPILADSLKVVKNTSTAPFGYKNGIHMFGSKSVYNLNNKSLVFGTEAVPTYVYFKNDKSPVKEMVAGSIMSAGSAAIGAGVGVVVGGLLGFLIAMSRKRRKYSEESEGEREQDES